MKSFVIRSCRAFQREGKSGESLRGPFVKKAQHTMENTNTPVETPAATLAQRAEKAFKDARDAAIAKNGFTKFAEAEQLRVFEAMVEFLTNDEEALTEGFDAIRPYVQAVANASAFAQLLEKNGKITRAKKGTGGSKAGFAN